MAWNDNTRGKKNIFLFSQTWIAHIHVCKREKKQLKLSKAKLKQGRCWRPSHPLATQSGRNHCLLHFYFIQIFSVFSVFSGSGQFRRDPALSHTLLSLTCNREKPSEWERKWRHSFSIRCAGGLQFTVREVAIATKLVWLQFGTKVLVYSRTAVQSRLFT